ncbi:hypothetical protein [Haladaptatus sp. DYSN1]|uniref:hypothetical protein n=1 Tax=unclassified Haladaptatus TaxID=2622732 RepID=UPI002406EC1D|nr:hypothetical protein [Haladaptatus sp. DYSN1]
MSATPDVSRALDCCKPDDAVSVTIDATELESTSSDYLCTFRRALREQNFSPSRIRLSASFDEDCSLATQRESDRVREYVRVADFLGATTVTLTIESVANPEKVRPALAACRERADREGITLEVTGKTSL